MVDQYSSIVVIKASKMELQLAVLAILLNTISAQISPDFSEVLDSKLGNNLIGSPSNTLVQGASATAQANAFSSASLSDYSSPSTYTKQLSNALASSCLSQQGGYSSGGRGEIIIHKPSPIVVRRPPTKVLVSHPPLIVRPAPVIFHRPPAVVVRPVVIQRKPAVTVDKPVPPPQPAPYVPPTVAPQPYLPCPPPAFGNPLLSLLAGSLLTPQPRLPGPPYSLPLMPQVPYSPQPYLPSATNYYYPQQAQHYPSLGLSPSLPSSSAAASSSAATSSGTDTGAIASSASSASSSSQGSSINDLRPVEFFPSNNLGGSSSSYDDHYF